VIKFKIAMTTAAEYAIDDAAYKAAGIDVSANEFTVVIGVRGTWWPACRLQLDELKQLVADGLPHGIALHATIAEPGGDTELLTRLANRGTEELGYGMHSDPDHKLLLKMKDDLTQDAPLFLIKTVDTSKYKSLTIIPYEDYSMVQPFMIVIKKSGDIQQVWSWCTDPLKDIEPKDEFTSVPGYGKMVLVRPITVDIALSIQENRSVALHSQAFGTFMKNVLKQQVGCGCVIN
jgi:hypothetical protein